MTPFAQLAGERAGLEKSAMPLLRAAGRGVAGLARNGIWGTIASKAKPGGALSRTAGAFTRSAIHPKTGENIYKSTGLAKGLMGYGFGGMLSPLAGVDLPGSSLAFNMAMPGYGALFSAPSLITAGRMSSQKNKDRLAADVRSGSDKAVNDLISLSLQEPDSLLQPGGYRERISQAFPQVNALRDQYAQGNTAPMSNWNKLQALFENPQKLINQRTDQRINTHNKLDKTFGDPSFLTGLKKQSSLEKPAMLGGIWKGIKAVSPYVFPAIGVGAIGHAALKDKPYDVNEAQNRGYAAGQLKLEDKLSDLTGIQRLGLKMDPTMLAREIEKQRPGSIANWEQATGNQFQPGWMSSIADRFSTNKPEAQDFYEYDAAGQRHYL